MIDVVSIYEDVAKDSLNKDENGYFSFAMFNRMSRRAELRLIDWLSGDVSGVTPPAPYLTQKNKDWLSPFIKKYPINVINGFVQRPDDYYQIDNAYIIGRKAEGDCGDEDSSGCNIPIELLNGNQFYDRCKTHIKGLQPSLSKPISKMVGKQFEYNPIDLGSIVIEYVRYPVFAVLKTKFDSVFNEEVPDPATSTNYEWDENSRELLIWFMTDFFANHISNQAMKQFNSMTGKTPREGK